VARRFEALLDRPVQTATPDPPGAGTVVVERGAPRIALRGDVSKEQRHRVFDLLAHPHGDVVSLADFGRQMVDTGVRTLPTLARI
jgi:hypothetical protein